jgi:hypothetical protein
MFAGVAGPAPDPSSPPFSVGRVVGRTFSIWGRNALPFSAIALLVSSPVIALAWAGVTAGERARGPLPLLLALLESVLALVTSGALAAGVLQALRGERPAMGRLLVIGLRKLGWLVLVSLGVGLAVGCGTALLVVPGLLALSGLYVTVPALMAEPERGAGDALSRSWELTRGHRWKVLALALLFSLGAGLLSIAAGRGIAHGSVALTGSVGGGALGLVQAVAVVLGGLAHCAPAVAYHDLRVEKEGASTEELAAVFE